MLTQDRLEGFLARLDGVKKTGNQQYAAKCPAHDDRTPSLSVSLGEKGQVVVYCHAGCDINQICSAVRWKVKDLYPLSDRHVVATYDYISTDGELLYQVVRYMPKDFRPRRPDGGGGWIWNLKDVPRVLYKLPELMTAPTSQTVFVVEGEKDVDRLMTLGLVATCNVGGAGKWRAKYNERFQGRTICVIADKDRPGRDHAQDVAGHLVSIAAEVRVLEMPGNAVKDASDWIANGGTREALLDLVAKTPIWSPNPQNLEAAKEEDALEAAEARGDLTQAEAIIALVEDAELFHFDDAAFATVTVTAAAGNGADAFSHRETHAINGRGFKDWVRRRYWQAYKRVPGAQAMKDALDVLAGKARYEGASHPVGLRVAGHGGAIYLDMANDRWEVVEITAAGWRVCSNPPVRFIRRHGMESLPHPAPGGSIDELRPLINAEDDSTWTLVISWLIGTFRPSGPYPILAVNGEQGSAKTTLGRVLRRLIDPNKAGPDDRDH